jgi:hypothetical protein
MLFREIITVYSENHMKHINVPAGKKYSLWMLQHVAHVVTTVLWRFNGTNITFNWVSPILSPRHKHPHLCRHGEAKNEATDAAEESDCGLPRFEGSSVDSHDACDDTVPDTQLQNMSSQCLMQSVEDELAPSPQVSVCGMPLLVLHLNKSLI